jgi:hypothetical protein
MDALEGMLARGDPRRPAASSKQHLRDEVHGRITTPRPDVFGCVIRDRAEVRIGDGHGGRPCNLACDTPSTNNQKTIMCSDEARSRAKLQTSNCTPARNAVK